MLARWRNWLKAEKRRLNDSLSLIGSDLPEGQTRDLVREMLGLFGLLALAGTLLAHWLGLSASRETLMLGLGISAFLLILRAFARRLSDRAMGRIFLAGVLICGALLGAALQTVQSVHLLMLAVPVVFTTFIYGPRLGLAYLAGVALIGFLLARHEASGSSPVRLDPYAQALLLVELLMLMLLLAMFLRRYVARTHQAAVQMLVREAHREGLAESRARLAIALEAGRFGVWEYDSARETLFVDARGAELLGLPAIEGELPVAKWLDRVVAEDRETALARGRDWIRHRGPLQLRYRVSDASGAVRWVSCESGGLHDQHRGRIIGVLADVTDDMAMRGRIEDALRRAEQAVSVAKAYFFELDLVTGVLVRDARAQSMLGLPLEESGRSVEAMFALVPEPARERACRSVADALEARAASFDVEVPVVHYDQSPRHFRVLGHIERDAGGQATRICGMSMEVTESRRARRDMERITKRFELAAEAGGLGLWEFDLKSQMVVQTPIGVRLFGLPSDKPVHVSWYLDRIHPDDRSLVEDSFRRTIDGGGGFEIVYRVRIRESTRWVRSAGRLERNDRGQPLALAGVNWDITEDLEARERLSVANDRLGLALSAAHASVWEYDGASDLVTWDERAADLYGVDPNPVGRRLDLIDPDDRAAIGEQIRQLNRSKSGQSFVLEYRVRHPQRGIRWLRCIGRLEVDPVKGDLRSVGIDIDVTAERTATEAIEQARQVAEAASRTKSAFLANMSHEIRTPMNAIIGMTGLAHRAASLTQASSYAAQAHSAARSLLTVLNDVLDFSKIEADRLDVENIPFSLEDVLGPVLDVAGFGASEKHLELLLDVGPGVRRRYVGDPARIGQILLNLTSNALKFTEQGFVRINVRHTPEASLRFEIADSGAGLSMQQQREVFEPFVQGDLSTSRRFGGTGLGLAICRRLAGLMHGELGVSSTPGRGSVFWLELPQSAATAATQTGIWEALPTGGPPVAIAHRLDQVRLCLTDQLAHLDRGVADFADAKSLQGWLAQQPAQSQPVVFIDRRLLPDNPTLWLAQLRTLPAAPRTVLLVRRLSNIPPGESALLEPPMPSQLGRSLSAGGLAQGLSLALPLGLPAPAEPLLTAASQPGAFAGVDILLVEDNDLNRALVLAILVDSGASVRIAENGVEAVAAVRRKLPDVVLMDIHMPIMDGYEATAGIRGLGAGGRDLPILATTADALEGDRDRALRAGMNDHLVKPVEPDLLLVALYRWTVVRRGVVAAEATSLPATAALPVSGMPALPLPPAGAPPAMVSAGEEASEAIVDAKGAMILDAAEGVRSCLGRPALFGQGLKIFLDVYTPVLDQLVALRPEQPQPADPDFKRLVHTLKGSVRSLGMMALSAVAVRLDAELRLAEPFTASQVSALVQALRAALVSARRCLDSPEYRPKDTTGGA